MKWLVMCEGPNEKAIVDMLLDAGLLVFDRDDLLGLSVYHARQFKSTIVKTNMNLYSGPVRVLRIGDSLTDKLVIPSEYKDRIESVEKYCTKPELEILLIISEGMEKAFEKVKSGKNKMKAKDFCKENIFCGKRGYDNSTQFYYDYFLGDVNRLAASIVEYKRSHRAHKKDEKYLADLLR